MKYLNIFLALLLIGMIACESGSEPEKAVLVGDVYDYDTDEPLPNVQIKTIPPSEVVMSNINGHFEVRTPKDGEYAVIASRKDYLETMESIAVSYDYRSNVILKMKKGIRDTSANDNENDIAYITGTVIDKETTDPLGGVAVSLKPLGDIKLTDNDGEFNFEITTLGSYHLTFEKSGYKKYQKNIDVSDYIVYSVNAQLEEDSQYVDPDTNIADIPYHDNLIAYWAFNYDLVEKINSYSTAYKGNVSFIEGKKHLALFPGYNSYISLPKINFNNMNEFSISIWINHQEYTHYNGGGYLMWGSLKNGYMGILNAVKPEPVKNDDSRYLYFASGARRNPDNESNDINPLFLDFLYTKTWTNYIMTYTDGILKVYINGKKSGELYQTLNIEPNIALLGAHSINGKGDNYDIITRVRALYDELLIYSRSLNEQEVKVLHEFYD